MLLSKIHFGADILFSDQRLRTYDFILPISLLRRRAVYLNQTSTDCCFLIFFLCTCYRELPPRYPDAYASINYKKTQDMCFHN